MWGGMYYSDHVALKHIYVQWKRKFLLWAAQCPHDHHHPSPLTSLSISIQTNESSVESRNHRSQNHVTSVFCIISRKPSNIEFSRLYRSTMKLNLTFAEYSESYQTLLHRRVQINPVKYFRRSNWKHLYMYYTQINMNLLIAISPCRYFSIPLSIGSHQNTYILCYLRTNI